MRLSAALAEKAKYEKIWRVPDYRRHSPGQTMVKPFLEICRPEPGSRVIDLGCGTGRAALQLQRRGFEVTGLDITRQALGRAARARLAFVEGSLWSAWPGQASPAAGWDHGFCCDVMEHIPVEYTMLVIDRIMSACATAFFSICTVPDQFGAAIGEPLHLSVFPFEFWRDHLGEFGTLVEARDLLTDALFVLER